MLLFVLFSLQIFIVSWCALGCIAIIAKPFPQKVAALLAFSLISAAIPLWFIFAKAG